MYALVWYLLVVNGRRDDTVSYDNIDFHKQRKGGHEGCMDERKNRGECKWEVREGVRGRDVVFNMFVTDGGQI